MATPRVTKDLTTTVGVCSFPKVFANTKSTKDDGTDDYNIQFIISKSDKEGVRAIMRAIKEVGEAKWGPAYKKVRIPLRNGDAEAGDLTEDGSTKGEKYPERLGCYFINARSAKPVAVIDRQRALITNSDELYAGCKVKVAVTFYPYSQAGNSGIGVALNGVQKVSDGEPIGGAGRPTIENMFDLLEDEDDEDLDMDDVDEVEETPPPAKKTAAKKAAPAKKTAAKKAAAPAPVVDEDDDLLEDGDDEADSEEWDDL